MLGNLEALERLTDGIFEVIELLRMEVTLDVVERLALLKVVGWRVPETLRVVEKLTLLKIVGTLRVVERLKAVGIVALLEAVGRPTDGTLKVVE